MTKFNCLLSLTIISLVTLDFHILTLSDPCLNGKQHIFYTLSLTLMKINFLTLLISPHIFHSHPVEHLVISKAAIKMQ